MAFCVEAIDHDAVIAGDRAKDLGGAVAERLQARSRDDGLDRPPDRRRMISEWPRLFEFDNKSATGRMMHERVKGQRGIAEMAAHGEGHFFWRSAQQRTQSVPEISSKLAQGLSNNVAFPSQDI